MKYTVRIEEAAQRFLKKSHDAKLVGRITKAIYALADNPRPYNCKRLQGSWHDCQMVRVSDYRIIYRVRDRELVVVVVEIGDRREVY